MRIEVLAAGYAANWEFSGSAGFESWSMQRPWLNQGGLCVIRSTAEGVADAFFPAICKQLRAAHGDERRLAIHRADCGGEDGTPMQAVLASMELDVDLNPFEAKDLLASRFMDRPSVFILSEKVPVALRSWAELTLLVEHFGKRTPIVPLCVVALDTRAAIQHSPTFDFAAGRCTQMLIPGSNELGDAAVWRSYLHHRSCWDSGGNLTLAQQWGDELSQCAPGDDVRVESTLNACANALAIKTGLESFIPQIVVALGRASHGREKAQQQLNEQRVLWKPPGLQRSELTPWASRALLSLPTLPTALVPRLRHNLVCMPLASEILSHCLNAEAKIRMQLEGKQTREPDEKTTKSFEAFRKGGASSVFYPSGHPSPPTRSQDVWQFAGLGQTMSACGQIDSNNPLWETVQLRNSMAHGHYVSWFHISRALRQSRRFDV